MAIQLTGCWVELYMAPAFGQPVRRLFGPVKYDALRAKGNGWGISFVGIAAGPHAYVLLYNGSRSDIPAHWLTPGDKIEDISEIDFAHLLDSVRVFDGPPTPDTDGYEAYIRRTARGPAKPHKASFTSF